MKLRRPAYTNDRSDYSVREAVEFSINRTHADGASERLEERVDNVARVLILVVAALAETRSLTKYDLLELLDGAFEVE